MVGGTLICQKAGRDGIHQPFPLVMPRQKGKEVEKTEGGEAEDTGVMEGFGTWRNCWHCVTDTKAIGHSGPAGVLVWTGSELGIRQDRWLESHYGEGVFHPNTDTPLNVINNTGRGNKTGD
ncbi:unnamed protein product [Boreogadus saida]